MLVHQSIVERDRAGARDDGGLANRSGGAMAGWLRLAGVTIRCTRNNEEGMGEVGAMRRSWGAAHFGGSSGRAMSSTTGLTAAAWISAKSK